VVVWTASPAVFSAYASAWYIPLLAAPLSIVCRVLAFAVRKAGSDLWLRRIFGAAFSLSSVITPFFLGTIAAAIASGRVPLGTASGDVIGSWLNPTSLLGGTLAVEVCAYLAAVYLTADSRRHGEHDLAGAFR